MRFNKSLFRKLNFVKFIRECHTKEKISEKVEKPKKNLTHPRAIKNFFQQNKEIDELKQYIPKKYLHLNRKSYPEYLYLISPTVAKTIASHLKPLLRSQGDQIICETNAGLGLIATELLDDGVPIVRFYETCSEFRAGLREFGSVYPGRVELFTKDIFQLSRYAYVDKLDRGNRVDSLLKNVPRLSWKDEPAMIITGPMPTLSFIKYLLESLALQNDIVNYGRMQRVVAMKPKHFAVLNASPKDNLSAYQYFSVLFQLFCDIELLDKFPRNVFLPWEPPPRGIQLYRYPTNLEPDKMYLVKIGFKETLPVPAPELLPLRYFVKQFYGRGSNRVIPTIEKWVPGCGLNIILPKSEHAEYLNDIDIFTGFRELTPNQILSVFKEMVNYPGYSSSPFIEMIENELVKIETIETSLSESLQTKKNVAEEIQEKFDIP